MILGKLPPAFILVFSIVFPVPMFFRTSCCTVPRMSVILPIPVAMPYPVFFPPGSPYTPCCLCFLCIDRYYCIFPAINIISVICHGIGWWILIQIHNVCTDSSLACRTSTADRYMDCQVLLRLWRMPLDPHKLLSSFRVIHISNAVISS